MEWLRYLQSLLSNREDDTDIPPDTLPPDPFDPGQEVIDLLTPLIESGEYRNYLQQWQEAGFHVRPDMYQIEREPFTTNRVDDLNRQFKPNLLILGAAKCGTFSLHMYLSQMPDVCMSQPKEPYFFECEYELGLIHYREKYFPHWMGERWIGESRHRNLYLSYVPQRVYETNPDAKLLVVVRNPIDRAYSHWWYWHSRDMDPLPFNEAIKVDYERIQRDESLTVDTYCAGSDASGKGIYRTYLDSGYYYGQIQRYLQYFPREQLAVLFLDDMKDDAFGFMQTVQQFIGVNYYTRENFSPIHANPAKEDDLTQPPMNPQTRDWLRKHYASHNAQLADFLGCDLSHWQ